MSTRSRPFRAAEHDAAALRPRYEVRASPLAPADLELSIWQLPSPATPRLREPERTAALHGTALQLVESRIVRLLRGTGLRLDGLRPGDERARPIEEDLALALALIFRTLAPMRSPERIRLVVERIERMSREEASYWLGMAVHRPNPRRVLAALRLLLMSE